MPHKHQRSYCTRSNGLTATWNSVLIICWSIWYRARSALCRATSLSLITTGSKMTTTSKYRSLSTGHQAQHTYSIPFERKSILGTLESLTSTLPEITRNQSTSQIFCSIFFISLFFRPFRSSTRGRPGLPAPQQHQAWTSAVAAQAHTHPHGRTLLIFDLTDWLSSPWRTARGCGFPR